MKNMILFIFKKKFEVSFYYVFSGYFLLNLIDFFKLNLLYINMFNKILCKKKKLKIKIYVQK